MAVGTQALSFRKLLLQPRQERARAAQHQRDDERPKQEAAAKVVHGAANNQREVFSHLFGRV